MLLKTMKAQTNPYRIIWIMIYIYICYIILVFMMRYE